MVNSLYLRETQMQELTQYWKLVTVYLSCCLRYCSSM